MRRGDPSRFVPELAVAANPFAWLRHLYYRWGLMLFCQAMGLDASLRGARRAGRFLHKNVPFFRNEIRRTFQKALGRTHDPQAIEAIARAHVLEFTHVFVETEFIARAIRRGTWPRYIRCVDLEPLIAAVQSGRGVVGASSYLGNHQVGMTVLGYLLGGQVAGIVSPRQYATQQRWMAHIVRTRLARLYPRGAAITGSLQALRDGHLLLIISEHVSRAKAAIQTEFLGRTQPVYPTPATLAWRSGCPIAVLTCHRLDERFRFELRLRDWIEPPRSGSRRDWIREATVRVMRRLDDAIREHPSQYAWTRQHLIAGRDET
jgi:lauroyl/myristoyl acyltransferase